MENIWLDIVKDALDLAIAESGEAVAGAKLRAAVAKIANAKNLDFPPPELRKFASFIGNHPQFFEIKWRPGHDILIAPQGKSELFKTKPDTSEKPASVSKRIRGDIFDALTRIFLTKKSAFYIPATDTIIWLEKSIGAPPDSAIAFPEHSTKDELDVRRQFCNSYQGGEQAKKAMAIALQTETDLKPFTDVIHSYGLVGDWHAYRFDFLCTKLRYWAAANNVAWREEWIVEDKPPAQAAARSTQTIILDNKQRLMEFCSSLGDDDIPRINVPLDIVLRLLNSK